MSTFIENQNWRYATKKFDASKKIANSDIEILKEAMRLSTSSYGLQPYTIFFIENEEIRKQLQPASWNQSQITDASHLIVIANKTSVSGVDIDALIENMSQTRNIPLENLEGYGNFMKSKLTVLEPHQINSWTAKQTYLVLGNLLNAAAELKIDVTPMEGFEPEKYNQILNLIEKGLNAALVATIGYRHVEDATQHYKKVRKSNEDLFIHI